MIGLDCVAFGAVLYLVVRAIDTCLKCWVETGKFEDAEKDF